MKKDAGAKKNDFDILKSKKKDAGAKKKKTSPTLGFF